MHANNDSTDRSTHHRHPTVFSIRLAFASLLAALCLTACGGGGGGGGGSTPLVDSTPVVTDPTVPVVVPDNTFAVDCAGANCGALNSSTYSGSGVGIWRYSNATATPVQIPVSLSGTLGRSVTLVMTNLADSSGLPGNGPTSPQLFGNNRGNGDTHVHTDTEVGAMGEPIINQVPARIRDFTPPALERTETDRAARNIAAPDAPSASVVGDSRTWYDHEDNVRLARLEKSVSASGGRIVNFWVEDGQYATTGNGVVTLAQLDALANAFVSGSNAVYSMVTGLAGQPWGNHPYSNLISPTQPLDVVLINIEADNAPWGLIGFFWGRNNFLQSSESFSNQSLSFYLDTETLHLGGSNGLKFLISTLAHEFVHMINFYQRAVVRSTQTNDYSFDTWIEEMSALMMEDVVGLKLDPLYHTIRDDRFPSWLNGGDFNCDVTLFDDDTDSPCFGYNLTGSFGAWLLRHYGIDFYQALLANTSSTDSIDVLDDAIRDGGGPGFKDAVRRWGTLLALLPAASSPPWFGLPQRSEQGFTLPAMNGSAYVNIRRLPVTAPNPLQPNGHYPQLRSNVGNTFVETVTIPANTTLTVIVQ